VVGRVKGSWIKDSRVRGLLIEGGQEPVPQLDGLIHQLALVVAPGQGVAALVGQQNAAALIHGPAHALPLGQPRVELPTKRRAASTSTE